MVENEVGDENHHAGHHRGNRPLHCDGDIQLSMRNTEYCQCQRRGSCISVTTRLHHHMVSFVLARWHGPKSMRPTLKPTLRTTISNHTYSRRTECGRQHHQSARRCYCTSDGSKIPHSQLPRKAGGCERSVSLFFAADVHHRPFVPKSPTARLAESNQRDSNKRNRPKTAWRMYLNNYLQGPYGYTRRLTWSTTQSGPLYDTQWLAIAYRKRVGSCLLARP